MLSQNLGERSGTTAFRAKWHNDTVTTDSGADTGT